MSKLQKKGNNNKKKNNDNYSSEEEDAVYYEDLNIDKEINIKGKSKNDKIIINNTEEQLHETHSNIRKKLFHERKKLIDTNTNDNHILKSFIESTAMLIERTTKKSDSDVTNNIHEEKKSIDFLELDNNNYRRRKENYPTNNNNNNNNNDNNNNNEQDDFDLNDYFPKTSTTKNKFISKNNLQNNSKTQTNTQNDMKKRKSLSLLDADLERPSHWKSSTNRVKVDFKKNTKKKKIVDPTKQINPTVNIQMEAPNTQNISFRPSWLRQTSNSNNNNNNNNNNPENGRMNDDIQENENDDNDSFSNETRRSSLEFTSGLSNKGISPPMSGKKKKHKLVAGSFAARYEKISRCIDNDENRLLNISTLPSKDPMDPRNRIEYWIDVVLEEEAIFREPFHVALITIEDFVVNDDKIKMKIQKFQHELKLDNFNEDNYTNTLMKKFQKGARILAYFKTNTTVVSFLKLGQTVRIYEPELCKFNVSNNNNNNNNNDNDNNNNNNNDNNDTTCLLCTQLFELLD